MKRELTEKQYVAFKEFCDQLVKELNNMPFKDRMSYACERVSTSIYADAIDIVELVQSANDLTCSSVARVLASSPKEKRTSLCIDTFTAIFDDACQEYVKKTVELADHIANQRTFNAIVQNMRRAIPV